MNESYEISEWIRKKKASRDRIQVDVNDIEQRISDLQEKLKDRRVALDLRNDELSRLEALVQEREEAWKTLQELEAKGESITDDDSDVYDLFKFVYTDSEAQARKIYYNR